MFKKGNLSTEMLICVIAIREDTDEKIGLWRSEEEFLAQNA